MAIAPLPATTPPMPPKEKQESLKRLEAMMMAQFGGAVAALDAIPKKKKTKKSKGAAAEAAPTDSATPGSDDEPHASAPSKASPASNRIVDDMRSDDEDELDGDGNGDGESVESDASDDSLDADELDAILNSALGRNSSSASSSGQRKSSDLASSAHDDRGLKQNGSATSKSTSKPSRSVVSAPQVVVFDDRQATRTEPIANKRDWRTFMSSDIKKMMEEPSKKKKLSEAEQKQDEEDDQNDRELMDLLKASKLIEQYTASELTGKDRRAYQQNKMIELGAKVKQQKMPQKMKTGLEKGRQIRQQKALQEAKDTGMYDSSLRRQIMGLGAPSPKEKKRKTADRGITNGVGRYKDGALVLSKKEIANIDSIGSQRPSAGGRGRSRSRRSPADSISGGFEGGGGLSKRKGRGKPKRR
ncbi:uncharacterized protein BJ171DRAFT_489512 [Polychytrium aggregatum]|uniref:uncharacterized protein n=1 Tax=Polychytrium aggregatum TaxID=110093 RepID=UPI0022FEE2F9|nr:uncharacterized protein BJ171DRAFT_489512 [Polychytrium aggregatum]KAI9208609.1 hypothetical protein BJ171DRAFT_489512 [Polychytrium aggregatum]